MPLLAMEGATILCTNLTLRRKASPAKSKGVYVLSVISCASDALRNHNLDTSTFPETAGLSTLCDGLSWDASKQADFQKMLSTPRLPAPLPGTSNWLQKAGHPWYHDQFMKTSLIFFSNKTVKKLLRSSEIKIM